jgi:hypothetical protein
VTPAESGSGPKTGLRTFEDLHHRFLEIEADLGLFDVDIDGVPFWERVRFEVHKQLLQRSGVFGKYSLGVNRRPLAERLGDMARSVTTHNPYRAESVDVVVFGHPRRKQFEDGLRWDIHLDPALNRINSRYVSLEAPLSHGHHRPAKTEHLRYLDCIEQSARGVRKLQSADPLEAADRRLLGRIERRVRSEFDVDIDVERMVEVDLRRRRSRLPVYEHLLKRLDPDLVVLTVGYGYGKETQIEACRTLDIPVAEVQHGVIDPFHVAYSFSGSRTKDTFPDHLLVFGPFWRDTAEYPIPDQRVHPVGYPFLESQRRKYSDRPTDERLVVISQGAIGRSLSRFAVELADHERFELEIVYKLHPAEAAGWRDAYPWLADAEDSGRLKVLDDTDSSLYELFGTATAQLGVYSTAVYEGLCFDLRTYVAALPGSNRLRPLVENGPAALVESVEELVALETDAQAQPSIVHERFFDPDALRKMPTKIDELADG